MRVLHLYSSKEPIVAQYVSLLAVHDSDMQTDDVRTFRELCQAHHPDIVHLHGCKNADMLKAAGWARRQGCRLVITPHGELQSWEQPSHMTGSYLRQVLPHAYVLIARSPMEADALRDCQLCTRVETVPNPIITRTTTTEHLLDSHLRIYQQVMDSNVLELMDEPTTEALHRLLKAGITQDERWVEPFDADAVNWHLLFIYAKLEGVMPYVERGMHTMRITQQTKPHTSSYLPDHYKLPEPLGHIFDIIKSIWAGYRQQELTLLPLVELDVALRRDDVEDDVLIQMLYTEKLIHFFAGLLPVVSEQTGIDEGFMPCPPEENRFTQRIRTIIKQHLEI